MHYHRGEERARALAEEIGGAAGRAADLTDEADVDRLFADAPRPSAGRRLRGRRGRLPPEDVPVWELDLERLEQTLRENLTATFLTARGFLREVARNGHGSLVLVGSTAGRFGEAGHADYAAAKAAIQGGLLLSLKNEVVRVAPARARQRRRAGLDGVADDPRPCRRRATSAGSRGRWPLRKVATARGRRGAGRRARLGCASPAT